MTDAGPRSLLPGPGTLRRPVAEGSVASFGPVATASTPETTQLTPEEQAAFEAWLKQNNIHDLDDPRSHYDYRGAFKAGVGREPGAEGHFPDTFKQHGHETFSNESKYSKGDGGTWEGDTFIPPKSGMRPSAAAEPRAKGPLGPLPAAPPKVNAPYGMTPGVRHLLPGINDQPPPIDWDQPMQFVMPDGSRIPLVSTNPRDIEIVNNLEKSLLMGSGDESEKRVARGVAEWARSMVGHMPIREIEKEMSDHWDHNVGNVVKRDISHNHIMAAAANRGANPRLVAKDDQHLREKYGDTVKDIIESERKSEKTAAMNDFDDKLDQMESALSSGIPLAERMAKMLQLVAVTGLASTTAERHSVDAGAGVLAKIENNIRSWIPGMSPGLAKSYLDELSRYIRLERSVVAKHRKDDALRGAARAQDALAIYGDEVRVWGGNHVYSTLSGDWGKRKFKPPTEGGPEPTAVPKVSMGPGASTPAPKAATAAPAPKAAPAPAAPSKAKKKYGSIMGEDSK